MAQVGGDLGAAAKGAIIGAWRGTNETSAEAVETIRAAAGGVVKGASEVAGNLGTAAKGAVQSAISGAKELGMDATKAASAAATGGLKPQAKSDPESQNKFVTPSQAPLLE